MNALTEQEIMALLDTMDPDEIMAEKKDQLDAAGRQLLEELRADIQAGDAIFEEYGRSFREADDEERPPVPSPPAKDTLTDERKSGGIRVPYWVLAAAALLVAIAFLPTLLHWGDPIRTRGRSLDLAEIGPINEQLVEILIQRGELLLEAGNKEGRRAYYEEARDDLMQAYELDKDHIALLALLARVHEKLGQEKRAQRFFKEWEAARGQPEEP